MTDVPEIHPPSPRIEASTNVPWVHGMNGGQARPHSTPGYAAGCPPGEARSWPVGLEREPERTREGPLVTPVATLLGMTLDGPVRGEVT